MGLKTGPQTGTRKKQGTKSTNRLTKIMTGSINTTTAPRRTCRLKPSAGDAFPAVTAGTADAEIEFGTIVMDAADIPCCIILNLDSSCAGAKIRTTADSASNMPNTILNDAFLRRSINTAVLKFELNYVKLKEETKCDRWHTDSALPHGPCTHKDSRAAEFA